MKRQLFRNVRTHVLAAFTEAERTYYGPDWVPGGGEVTEPFKPTARADVCAGCHHTIDPTTCGCGSPITHSAWEGHAPRPMGCDCGRA